MKQLNTLTKQIGAASLLTAVILLVAITLVSILTAKTVLQDTKITANNYRTAQANSAAQAAMDAAVSYYLEGGLDHDNLGNIDYINAGVEPTVALCQVPVTTKNVTAYNTTLVAPNQTTFSRFYFDNTLGNSCGITTSDMTQGMITAKGWSDDCSAVRTITQCVAPFDILNGGDSPQQPFVSRAGVGVFGNAKIINRYNNSSIWAGGPDSVHGASYGTYNRPSDTQLIDYTQAELDSSCAASPCNDVDNPGPNTQIVSNAASGNGIDVITNDATLKNQSSNDFFQLFFAKTKQEIKTVAENSGRIFAPSDSLDGESGLIWVDGDVNINGTDVIGSPNNLVILIIDGNLDKLNGATIYGIIYVTGTLEIAGNPIVKGSMVAESLTNSTGAGTLTLVYKPWGDSTGGTPLPFIPGTGAIVAGSWKDW